MKYSTKNINKKNIVVKANKTNGKISVKIDGVKLLIKK